MAEPQTTETQTTESTQTQGTTTEAGTTQPTGTTAPTQTAPATEDWPGKYGQLDNRYKILESNIKGFMAAIPQAEQMFVKWHQGQKFDPAEFFKAKQEEVAQTKTPKGDGYDPSKVESMIEERLNGALEPILNQMASSQTASMKSGIQEEYPWVTDQVYSEFLSRFNKSCATLEQNFTSQGYNPKTAHDMAISQFQGFDPQDLFIKFMRKEFVENLSNGKKPSVLPHGMIPKGGNKAGSTPGVVDQARNAYRELSKQKTSPEAIAEKIAEIGQAGGIDEAELVNFYKEVTKG